MACLKRLLARSAGHGLSEQPPAQADSFQALKEYRIPREKVIILTKCCGYVGEGAGTRTVMHGQKITESKDYVNRGGLSRRAIQDNVNQSLKRLGVDYIDLLQIHRFDPHTPIEETMEALHDLVKSGKVGQTLWT